MSLELANLLFPEQKLTIDEAKAQYPARPT
jgi:hypothetical protein